jgi:hypothetical protein
VLELSHGLPLMLLPVTDVVPLLLHRVPHPKLFISVSSASVGTSDAISSNVPHPGQHRFFRKLLAREHGGVARSQNPSSSYDCLICGLTGKVAEIDCSNKPYGREPRLALLVHAVMR